jgi:hypothetical protein
VRRSGTLLSNRRTRRAQARWILYVSQEEEHVQRYISRMIGLFVLAAIFMAPAALAQEQAPPMPSPEEFTAEELDAFAEAYVDVEEVQARFQAEYGEVTDPEEAVRVQQVFQEEVSGAVQARGLDAERYDAIVRTSQVDEDFAQVLLTRINDARQNRVEG